MQLNNFFKASILWRKINVENWTVKVFRSHVQQICHKYKDHLVNYFMHDNILEPELLQIIILTIHILCPVQDFSLIGSNPTMWTIKSFSPSYNELENCF